MDFVTGIARQQHNPEADFYVYAIALNTRKAHAAWLARTSAAAQCKDGGDGLLHIAGIVSRSTQPRIWSGCCAYTAGCVVI